ncbi:hypothetical protein K431DRAFT_299464 [Polychaeton citri CBS 116435]|uniref:Uncharacterized protein n=1 Tax=Polychaeton citri CBS 116435 TaxID=1314669 RepID=A0A9P4QK79_9PEZI|nr:hypothetical protein K431DRAFT_299464 [Polychaeton citri CBS 116435]
MKFNTNYFVYLLVAHMELVAAMAPPEYLNCNNRPTDALGFENGQFSVDWFLDMYRKSDLDGPFENRCVFYTKIVHGFDHRKSTPDLVWDFCDQQNAKTGQSLSCGMISIWDAWPGWLFDPRGYGKYAWVESDDNQNSPLRDIMSDPAKRLQYFKAMSTAFGLLCGGRVWLVTKDPRKNLKGVSYDTIFIQDENPALNNQEAKKKIEAPEFEFGTQIDQNLQEPPEAISKFWPGLLIPPPPRSKPNRRSARGDDFRGAGEEMHTGTNTSTITAYIVSGCEISPDAMENYDSLPRIEQRKAHHTLPAAEPLDIGGSKYARLVNMLVPNLIGAPTTGTLRSRVDDRLKGVQLAQETGPFEEWHPDVRELVPDIEDDQMRQ